MDRDPSKYECLNEASNFAKDYRVIWRRQNLTICYKWQIQACSLSKSQSNMLSCWRFIPVSYICKHKNQVQRTENRFKRLNQKKGIIIGLKRHTHTHTHTHIISPKVYHLIRQTNKAMVNSICKKKIDLSNTTRNWVRFSAKIK